MKNNEISPMVAPAYNLKRSHTVGRKREPRGSLGDSVSGGDVAESTGTPEELEFTRLNAREGRATRRECQTSAEGPPQLSEECLLVSTCM